MPEQELNEAIALLSSRTKMPENEKEAHAFSEAIAQVAYAELNTVAAWLHTNFPDYKMPEYKSSPVTKAVISVIASTALSKLMLGNISESIADAVGTAVEYGYYLGIKDAEAGKFIIGGAGAKENK